MSIDIDIGDYEFNLTYNYSYMYCKRGVNQIRALDGMTADHARLRLKWLRSAVENLWYYYKEQEEERCAGWSSVEEYHKHLNRMIRVCLDNPLANVRVT